MPVGLTKIPEDVGRKRHSDKPNQNSKCPCRKPWEVAHYDRICSGKVQGVGHVSYYRDQKTRNWWSADQTNHGGSTWKVHGKNGEWIADADIYGDYMSKHKSAVGKNIDFKELKCKDAR